MSLSFRPRWIGTGVAFQRFVIGKNGTALLLGLQLDTQIPMSQCATDLEMAYTCKRFGGEDM